MVYTSKTIDKKEILRAVSNTGINSLPSVINIIMSLQPIVEPWSLFQYLYSVHSRYDSLDGGSACRKFTTYTGNHK
jgi:hypothetical protein